METSSCDAKHAVVHAQNDRSCLGPIETCYSGPEVAVLHAKSTGGVVDPQSLVILALKSLFCMHKTIGEGWDIENSNQEIITLLCMFKTTG